MRDLVGIRYYLVFSGVELQMVKAPNVGSLMLPASERQISGYPPASGSIENRTDSDIFFVTLLDMLCSAFC